MPFTRATYHFAAVPDVCQANTLYIHTDGYPIGAAGFLRTMLLDQGASHARAFQRAHQQRACVAKEPHGDNLTSFRYQVSEYAIVAEERVKPGVDEWKPVFEGQLLDFIHSFSDEPMLHNVGPSAEGGIQFCTLATIEEHLAQDQGEALRYEAGVWAPCVGPEAQARVDRLRTLVVAALKAELSAGRQQAQPAGEVLKRFTVIGEYLSNSQGYCGHVLATDDDHASELAIAEVAASLLAEHQQSQAEAKERGWGPVEDYEEPEEGDEPELRVWAVLPGWVEPVAVRDAM